MRISMMHIVRCCSLQFAKSPYLRGIQNGYPTDEITKVSFIRYHLRLLQKHLVNPWCLRAVLYQGERLTLRDSQRTSLHRRTNCIDLAVSAGMSHPFQDRHAQYCSRHCFLGGSETFVL